MTFCCPLGIYIQQFSEKHFGILNIVNSYLLSEIWNSDPSSLHTQIHKKPHFKFHLIIYFCSSNIWKIKLPFFFPLSAIIHKPESGKEFLRQQMRQRFHLGQPYGISVRTERCFPQTWAAQFSGWSLVMNMPSSKHDALTPKKLAVTEKELILLGRVLENAAKHPSCSYQ